jgi:hypothetical protein
MKKKEKIFIFALAASVVANICLLSSVKAQETEQSQLLEKVVQKLDSYPKYENWKALVVTTLTRMDKNWKPQKVTIIDRIVNVTSQERNDEILKAVETEKGMTRDITQKYIKEMKERQEKARKEEEDRKKKGEKEEERDRREMKLEEFFPFSVRDRVNYEFAKLEDANFEGQPVFVLESKAKIKNENLWEGRYYISKESFDILKIEVQPSKNPKFVQELQIEMAFRILPQGYFVLRKIKTKINGGMFLKHIRMITEEEYTDFEIISKEKAPNCTENKNCSGLIYQTFYIVSTPFFDEGGERQAR